MSFDDVTLWLISAMSLTAVVFLLWTLVALVRTSRRRGAFGIDAEGGQSLSAMAPQDRDPA
jgi:hypothetical protein